MLQRSNSGGDNDITFRLRVENDRGTNDRELAEFKRQVNGAMLPPVGLGGAGAGRTAGFGGGFGGGGGYGGASVSVPPAVSAPPPYSPPAYRSFAAADERLNRSFDTHQNRFMSGVGSFASSAGMLNLATGGNFESGVRTLAGIEAGVAAYRGVSNVASGLRGMAATGGAAYALGRGIHAAGAAGLALGAGAALGYGVTYLRGNESERAHLYDDVTETIGMHTRGADAERRAASAAERGERQLGDIRSFQRSYASSELGIGMDRFYRRDNPEEARRLAAEYSTGGFAAASNSRLQPEERESGMSRFVEGTQKWLEATRKVGDAAEETLNKKADGEAFITRELERQLGYEKERTREAEGRKTTAEVRYAQLDPAGKARVDMAARAVIAGTATARQLQITAPFVPDIAEEGLGKMGAGQMQQRRSPLIGLLEQPIVLARAKQAEIGEMVGDQRGVQEAAEKARDQRRREVDAEIDAIQQIYLDGIKRLKQVSKEAVEGLFKGQKLAE